MASSSDSSSASLYFWLLDTRELWNEGTNISEAASLSMLSQCSCTLSIHQCDIPKCLTDERQKAESFHFKRDGKLSLGSSLLKRLFASRVLSLEWSETRFVRKNDAVHGKPSITSSSGKPLEDADFNVAHQAGLVTLVGSSSAGVRVGVDIVCDNERPKQHEGLTDQEQVNDFVETYGEVFSPADIHAMKEPILGATTTSDAVKAKLRRFYAYWALKEAYIKMVGEGLLAKWLKDVEFRKVRVPRPAVASAISASAATSAAGGDARGRGDDSDTDASGEETRDIEVYLKGKSEPENVQVTLQAFGEHYMIATCISPPPCSPHSSSSASSSSSSSRASPFKMLSLQNDIYPYSTNHS